MINQFSRTKRLIGDNGLINLANRTVLIFGVGGVGSHCIEALARGGIGRIIIVDPDRVNITNINRQSIAYHSTIGQFKTQIMATRIADINPHAEVIPIETFILPDNIDAFFSQLPKNIDYIIDAIDTVAAKIAIIEYAQKQDIPLICSMGTGNKLHAELFKITDLSKTSVCPLCRVMRRELKSRGIEHVNVLYSTELPITPFDDHDEITTKRATPGSVSFVPPVAGLLIAGEVLRHLMFTTNNSF